MRHHRRHPCTSLAWPPRTSWADWIPRGLHVLSSGDGRHLKIQIDQTCNYTIKILTTDLWDFAAPSARWCIRSHATVAFCAHSPVTISSVILHHGRGLRTHSPVLCALHGLDHGTAFTDWHFFYTSVDFTHRSGLSTSWDVWHPGMHLVSNPISHHIGSEAGFTKFSANSNRSSDSNLKNIWSSSCVFYKQY